MGWTKKYRVARLAAAMTGLVLLATPVQASVQSQAYYARGLIAYNKGEWSAAQAMFDKATQADPNDAWSVYYRGLVQGKQGNSAAAIADIEKALALAPDLPHAALDLGIANLDAGRLDEAKTWLERAYQQASERRVAALFLGIVAYRLGENAEASKYLKEAEVDPEVRTSARYYDALALIRQRRGDAARVEMQKLTQESPDSEMAVAARPYLADELSPSSAGSGAARRKPWAAYGKAGIEYDSNVIAGPSDNPVQPTPLPQGAKPTDVSAEGDGSVVLAAGGNYQIVENEKWSLTIGGDVLSSIHFSLTDFDLLGFPLWMEIASHWGEIRYGVAGEWHYYLLDYANFYQEGLATPWVSFPEAAGLTGQVYYTFRGRDFFDAPFDPGRDGINNAVGLRQQMVLENIGLTLNGGLQYDKEDPISNGPMGRDFEYSGYQLDIGASYSINEQARVGASYLFRLEDYENPNSLAGVANKQQTDHAFRRHDNAHFILINGEYYVLENVALTAGFLAVVNGSNIPNFEYDRFIISPGVRVGF